MRTLLASDSASDGGQSRSAWVVETGHLPANEVKRFDCEAGFSVVSSSVQSSQDQMQACAYEGSERNLVLTFGLEGDSEFRDRNGDNLYFRSGYTTVSSYLKGRGERCHPGQRPVRQLRLIVSESALLRYVGPELSWHVLRPALARSEGTSQLSFGATAASMHLRALSDVRLLEQQNDLGLRIQALSLLAEQLRLLTPPARPEGRLRADEMDKMAGLDAFMRANLDQLLSMASLCAQTGLSEYKLKDAFRKAYGVSPGQRLLELRMQRALELLERGQQVAQAAYQVGYQHPSNFSAAFARYFGKPPKAARC